jgi:signal transduction histidine kinase
VQINDTGAGFQGELGLIFDPFSPPSPRVEAPAWSSICHGIIERLGGRISVDSEVGKGSSFTSSYAAIERGDLTMPAMPKFYW